LLYAVKGSMSECVNRLKQLVQEFKGELNCLVG
jgi:hypothetical protein